MTRKRGKLWTVVTLGVLFCFLFNSMAWANIEFPKKPGEYLKPGTEGEIDRFTSLIVDQSGVARYITKGNESGSHVVLGRGLCFDFPTAYETITTVENLPDWCLTGGWGQSLVFETPWVNRVFSIDGVPYPKFLEEHPEVFNEIKKSRPDKLDILIKLPPPGKKLIELWENNRVIALWTQDKVDVWYVDPETKPFIQDGITFVPLREVFKKLGVDIAWNEKDKSVTFSANGHTVSFVPGSREALVDGRLLKMPAPAKIINGRTMVPLRFISENLGYKVDYRKDGNYFRYARILVEEP